MQGAPDIILPRTPNWSGPDLTILINEKIQIVHVSKQELGDSPSPTSVYEVLIVLYCHSMRPHACKKKNKGT